MNWTELKSIELEDAGPEEPALLEDADRRRNLSCSLVPIALTAVPTRHDASPGRPPCWRERPD